MFSANKSHLEEILVLFASDEWMLLKILLDFSDTF